MIRTSDITSFTDVRQNLREHFDRLKETGRPLYVTTNGETDAVMLSPEAFDELRDRAERLDRLADLERGLADVRAGRVHDFREAIQSIAAKHGPKLQP